MTPIPQTITNVSIYPYIPAPIVVQPVVENAVGTYSVGTLTTRVFYNLDLHGGTMKGKLEKGGTYYAVATDAEGKQFQTHWMYCTDASDAPTFGLTQNMAHPEMSAPAMPLDDGLYIKIEELTDFTTIYTFKPPAIGTAEITLGKSGWLIASRIGTPHESGFLIENPEFPSFFSVGSRNISISAKTQDGKTIGFGNLTLVSASPEEAIFMNQLV